MEPIKNIVKMPERRQEESGGTHPDSRKLNANLERIKENIRRGISMKANDLMGIPERYRGKVLPVKAQRELEAFRKGKSLFLTGIPGSGKTHLAVTLMNEWLADSMIVGDAVLFPSKGLPMFLPAIDFFLEIKESWRTEESVQANSEKKIIERYTEKPLLVIDDLGAEKISDWSRTVGYALLDRRYRAMKQTIITSNLSLKELAEKLDGRLASRIAEMGEVVKMADKDYRVERKHEKT